MEAITNFLYWLDDLLWGNAMTVIVVGTGILLSLRFAFAYQRKALSNGLAASFPALGKTGAAEVIAASSLPANIRCGQMTPADFAAVSRAIAERGV